MTDKQKIYISDRCPTEPGDYNVRFHNGIRCIYFWPGEVAGNWKNNIEYFYEPKL